MRILILLAAVSVLLAPPAALAQKARVSISGTWTAETPEGPRKVVIRPDSSASYGAETVRWRLAGDSIHIAFGEEWMVYHLALRGNRMTLSGGDLEEPIRLRRTGPATPLPDTVTVPTAPPENRRADPLGPAGGSRPGSGD